VFKSLKMGEIPALRAGSARPLIHRPGD